MRAPAPAKINLALVVGPLRDDGKHELVTDLPARRAYPTGSRSSRPPSSASTASPATRSSASALEALAATRRRRAALARDDREAAPRRGRARRRQLRRGDGPPARERDAQRAAAARTRSTSSPPASAPTCRSFSQEGPQLGTGDGTTLAPLDLPQDYWVLLVLPRRAEKPSTASVYAAFDARDGARGWEERRDALHDGARARPASRGTSPRCPETTSRGRLSPTSCSTSGRSAPT